MLLAAQGLSNDVIAARLDLPRQVVSKWRKRFWRHRLPGLEELPRLGNLAAHPETGAEFTAEDSTMAEIALSRDPRYEPFFAASCAAQRAARAPTCRSAGAE